MTRALWFKLALPLALLAAASIWLNSIRSMDGFFLNLATELIGIIVTVAYVDWIIKAHERKSWEGTSSRIADRLRVLSNATTSGIRSSLGYGVDILNDAVMRSGDLKRMNEEVMRIGIHVLQPSLRSRLEALDVKGWKSLAEHLQGTWRETERLLDRFSQHLEPMDLELLLDLQQEIQNSLTFWSTFPDIVGVPDQDLPTTRSDTVALKSAWNDLTAESLSKVLQLAKSISGRSNA